MRVRVLVGTRIASTFAITLALGGPAAAQQDPGRPGQPPVLSTTPTPTGVRPEPAQMSGLPLQVGDLPPGTVAVRVVRRSFAENIVNQRVELQVLTPAGRVLQGTTDATGRAMFSGLHVGDVVMTRTTVDGEQLESQNFELPAQGGVRLALVAGIGAGKSQSGTPAVATPAAPLAPAPATGSDAARWWVASVVSAVLGVAVLAIGMRRHRRDVRRRLGEAFAPARSSSLDRREVLFQELIRLEDDHSAGRVEDKDYHERRTSLIDQLVAIDAARQDA